MMLIHSFLACTTMRRSAKRRHHSPGWMILSHVSCFVQFNSIPGPAGSLHPRIVRGRPGSLIQFSKGEPLKSAWHLIRLTRLT